MVELRLSELSQKIKETCHKRNSHSLENLAEPNLTKANLSTSFLPLVHYFIPLALPMLPDNVTILSNGPIFNFELNSYKSDSAVFTSSG